jgi:hypothetical protein
MMDLIYVVGTIAFFGAMLAYLRACEALGRDADDDGRAS